jgi:hypothetical protein
LLSVKTDVNIPKVSINKKNLKITVGILKANEEKSRIRICILYGKDPRNTGKNCGVLHAVHASLWSYHPTLLEQKKHKIIVIFLFIAKVQLIQLNY